MASEKQIAANRKNASRSTGPKTASGRQRMRLNAMTHGLTARTVVLPGEDAEALRRRVEAFKDDVQPRGALEDYLVERAAHVSWQLDRADRTIAARLTDAMPPRPHPTRPTARPTRSPCWPNGSSGDPVGPICSTTPISGASASSRRRGSRGQNTVDDPLNPARIVHRLEAFAAGRRWLLDRWGELRKILEEGVGSGGRPTGCGPSA